MAVNNHFFFSCLSPKSTPVEIPAMLENELKREFGSIEALRAEMIASANAMFGPGFVWLVKTQQGSNFRILNTYLAGSPYSQAHYRRQSVDMNTQNVSDYGTGKVGAGAGQEYTLLNPVGAFGSAANPSERKPAEGGINVSPILCVNTWQHVWLQDWGFEGKQRYLEAWWDRIDWDVVSSNSNLNIMHSFHF
jgi:Fe-Mn family superoxide dismutase